ncbi:MAG: amidase [Chloroflexi bacterium]|jgi:amidase|nr:amidase [Chloroflexota bacterium]
MPELIYRSATELAELIREKKASATEILEAHLAQIAKYNPSLNAIVTLNEENARQTASAADAALEKGVLWGPLHGVPITIKDAFETAGLRTTSSFKPLANYIPEQDATVVARLRQAGAIVLGKTNMPMLALDIQSDSPLFGRANNPWNITCTPGGSTGGGAASLAAGFSPLEIGSDLGGSVRIPAHFCGVFALKPTDHLISLAGHIPEPPGSPQGVRHMGMPGPLARSIDDLRLALSLIAGADGRRWEAPPITVTPVQKKPLKTYRIAWTDHFGGVAASQETRAIMQKLAGDLGQAGCHVEQISPPDFDYDLAWQLYGEIAGAEIGSGMDTIPRLLTSLQFRRMADPSPLKKGYVSGLGLKMTRYAEALTSRDLLIAQLEVFLSKWDAWLCPVTVGAAFKHCKTGQPIEIDGQDVPYFTANMSFTTIFNMTGNPVVVLPAGHTKAGIPVGIQAVGQRWNDMALLAAAEALTEITGKFQSPPNF